MGDACCIFYAATADFCIQFLHSIESIPTALIVAVLQPQLACRQIRNMLSQSGASHIGIIADVAHSRALRDIDHILREADGIIFQVTAHMPFMLASAFIASCPALLTTGYETKGSHLGDKHGNISWQLCWRQDHADAGNSSLWQKDARQCFQACSCLCKAAFV